MIVTQPETPPAHVVVCAWDVERLCRYGARGALTLTRLKREEDGRLSYRMKRPLPDGTSHLFFSGLELLRRLSGLVPPPRAHLTRFHGVFAPGAKLKPWVRPQQQAQPGPEVSRVPVVVAEGEHTRRQPPRLDWAGLLRRSFEQDIFACTRCGGRRRVVAYLTSGQGVRSILEHLGLPSRPPRLAPARGPPQSAWC